MASHAAATKLKDMGVDHGVCLNGVAQQLLHRSDVDAVLQEMSCKAMPKRVRRGWLGDSGGLKYSHEFTLEALVVEVVAPKLAAAWIGRDSL